MLEGKYFVLVSKHCNLTLGIQDNSNQEGTLAVLCNKNEYEPHQVWYEDVASGTIRSKANDLCLTLTEGENRIRLASYKPGDQSQQWRVSGGVVHHRVYHNKVLDIVDGRQDCGAVLCSWDFHSGPNQQWEVQYLPARLFYIVSELNGLVLDIAGASQDPGAKLILWDKKGSDAKNQLWYEDRSGFLRSALNNFAPDGSTTEITMQPFAEDNPNRCWFIYGSTIYLGQKQDQVFDILGGKTEAGAAVGVYQTHGGPNQKWYQEFVN